jgi:hypothetical protein
VSIILVVCPAVTAWLSLLAASFLLCHALTLDAISGESIPSASA